MDEVYLQELTKKNSSAYSKFADSIPDTGQISFCFQHKIDAFQSYSYLKPNTYCVIAKNKKTGEIVGSAIVTIGKINYEGELRPYAMLDGLQVRPDHRRQGLASRLAKWRIDFVQNKLGDDCVIFAVIQSDNKPSFANARKWCNHFSQPCIGGVFKMRPQPPQIQKDITIQNADVGDYEEISYRLNSFYKDYNFFTPHTPEYLANWIDRTPFPEPINYYVTAKDKAGKMLAGLGITVEAKLRYRKVSYMPLWMNLANKIFRIVPLSGELHEIKIEKLWFLDGQLSAARSLWEIVRWEWRDQGNVLFVAFDPKGPLTDVFQLPAYMPKGKVIIAVKGPVPMDDTRLIYAIL